LSGNEPKRTKKSLPLAIKPLKFIFSNDGIAAGIMSAASERATGPAVWSGKDFIEDDNWVFRLSSVDIQEIDKALCLAKRISGPIQEITPIQFPLPHLGERLQLLQKEIESGRGFVVIKGIPVETYNDYECKILSWGLCSYFGRGMQQSRQGDWINHVIDLEGIESTTNPDLTHIVQRKELRYSHKGGELRWHTDTTDIIGLFCLKTAKSGGNSRLASAGMVHNLILEKCPEFIDPLYRGYFYMSLGDDDEFGTPRISDQRIPVFRSNAGDISFYYIPQVIERAIDRAEIKYNEAENKARSSIQKTADLPGVALEFMLDPGDLEIINNRTVMHSRGEYEDHLEIENRRHLLRLWMAITPEMMTKTLRTPADL